jgi:uncharacterized protein (TIGR03083 family)
MLQWPPMQPLEFDRDAVRRLVRQQCDGLAARLDQLSPEQWHTASTCPGWEVADVVAHLSSGADVQLRSLRRGLDGETSPVFSDPAERQALSQAKLDMPEAERAADYRRELGRLLDFMDGLSEGQMAKTAWHQSGVYPLPWFLLQRLGEITMHRGDILEGLGDTFDYPEEVAALLVPIYAARLPRLVVAKELPPALIRFGSFGFVRLGADGASYDTQATDTPTLNLDGSAAALLRVAVGRLHPREVHAGGDTNLLDRWREIFRTL